MGLRSAKAGCNLLKQAVCPLVIGAKSRRNRAFLSSWPVFGTRRLKTRTPVSASCGRGEVIEQHPPERAPEFWKGFAMTGDRRNPFHLEPAPHRRDGVRERHVALPRPVDPAPGGRSTRRTAAPP